MNFSSKWLAVVLFSSAPTLFAGTITVTTVKDSTTVLHNPAMGFFFHYESQMASQGDWSGSTDWIYYTKFTQAINYCNILYIRTSWKSLEPSKGVYAWDTDPGFKAILAAAKAHGFRLSLRANAQDNGPPQFVVDEIRAAGRDPYPTKQTFLSGDSIINLQDPVWQAEFAQFVSAFGKAFDTPNTVDFIDINGLSNSGEGNAWVEGFAQLESVPQGTTDVPKDQAPYFDWHVAQYDAAFKNVLLADQWYWNIPIDEKYGLVSRIDGFGGPDSASWKPWDTIAAPFVMIGEPWGGTATIAQTAAQFISARCNVVSWRQENLWMANPSVLAYTISKIGYRLRPAQLDFPSTASINSPTIIHHTWVNDARGYLPNNNRRWNKKYSIAFALFPQTGNTPVQVVIDPATNPGDFFERNSYPLRTTARWNVPVGSYKLAVGIIDKTRPADSSLALSIANPTKRSGWYLLGDIQLDDQTPTTSAFSRIEAEDYNSSSVNCTWTCSEGGENLGCIASGNYAFYKKVDFGSGAQSFLARLGSPGGTGKITLHLDSLKAPAAGILANPIQTNDWEVFATNTTNIPTITGIHDLYLEFEAGFDLNWFSFGDKPSAIQPQRDLGHNSAILHGNQLVLSLGWKAKTKVRVVSLSGQEMYQATVSDSNANLSLGPLPKGLYLIKAQSDLGAFTQRVFKN